jgi:hypothetical protein
MFHPHLQITLLDFIILLKTDYHTQDHQIETHKAKEMSQMVTPGSWPARIPRNPVVPTTVKRKAACIRKKVTCHV